MTRIEFFFNVEDKLQKIAELCDSAVRKGRRLIEIVGLDEADRSAARERYRFYRDRGYEIKLLDQTGAAM